MPPTSAIDGRSSESDFGFWGLSWAIGEELSRASAMADRILLPPQRLWMFRDALQSPSPLVHSLANLKVVPFLPLESGKCCWQVQYQLLRRFVLGDRRQYSSYGSHVLVSRLQMFSRSSDSSHRHFQYVWHVLRRSRRRCVAFIRSVPQYHRRLRTYLDSTNESGSI